MANIALVGASGNIGKKILDEALARGHRVTGTTRDAANLPARDSLIVAAVSAADSAALARVLQGHDAIVVSLRWEHTDTNSLLEAIRTSGVRRALFVVGAGSLLRSDGRLHFEHMTKPTPSSKPAMLALDVLRQVHDLEWTAISPPATIQPGERTGKFRSDIDNLVIDANGDSRISREDFAVAIIDEIEKPKHIRQRFTVGY